MAIKKSLTILLVAIAISLGGRTASAVVSYDRNPDGIEIAAPVEVNVAVDAYSDFEWGNGTGASYKWGFVDSTYAYDGGSGLYVSTECSPAATLSNIFNVEIPVGTAIINSFPIEYNDGSCASYLGGASSQEYAGEEPIFTIIEGETAAEAQQPSKWIMLYMLSGFIALLPFIFVVNIWRINHQ